MNIFQKTCSKFFLFRKLEILRKSGRALALILGLLYPFLMLAVPNQNSPASQLKPVDPARAKARYYFLQGSIEASNKNMDKAYEYFKKAYETDPGFHDAAFTYGSQRLFLRNDTMQSDKEMLASLALMQRYVDHNPRDVYATQLYGYITTALDTLQEAERVYEKAYELMPAETQLLDLLAEARMRQMNFPGALEALEKYEKIEGKTKDISLKKITIYLASKDTVGAILEAQNLVDANPRDPYCLIMQGNLYEITGNMDSVLQSYRKAEELAPDNGTVKMSLAQYYREIGDSIMLDNMVYEALLSEDFELEDKLGILGEYLQKLLDEKGDKSRGDHLFSVLHTQYPHEPQVLDMAARYSAAKGEFKTAAEDIGYAIDMEPTNETYWQMLVSYRMADENYPQAVKDYNKANEVIEPPLSLKNLYAAAASMLDDANATDSIISGLLREIDPALLTVEPEATDSVRRSLDYDQLQYVSSLYCILGDMYFKNGQSPEAFQEYEMSLYFIPDNVLTLNNYAYFLSEEDLDLEKAKKMSHRVLELVDNNPTYLDTYAWVLYKLGEYHEAMEYIEQALDVAKEVGDDNEEYLKHYEAIKEKIPEDELP